MHMLLILCFVMRTLVDILAWFVKIILNIKCDMAVICGGKFNKSMYCQRWKIWTFSLGASNRYLLIYIP